MQNTAAGGGAAPAAAAAPAPSATASPDSSPHYSIDVECVATSTDHNARAVAHIALVDASQRVVLDLYVQPDKPVVSYLTPLTGLTKELLDSRGIPLQQAVSELRANLPKHAVLVGQNIRKDVEWLGLQEGVDFEAMKDLAGLYRAWNPQYRSWSVFGQDHVAEVLLGWKDDVADGGGEHSAVKDAIKSIALYNHYNLLQATPGAWEQAQAQLLAAPPKWSFARRHPTWEGVCMGNRKACTCGAPFFS